MTLCRLVPLGLLTHCLVDSYTFLQLQGRSRAEADRVASVNDKLVEELETVRADFHMFLSLFTDTQGEGSTSSIGGASPGAATTASGASPMSNAAFVRASPSVLANTIAMLAGRSVAAREEEEVSVSVVQTPPPRQDVGVGAGAGAGASAGASAGSGSGDKGAGRGHRRYHHHRHRSHHQASQGAVNAEEEEEEGDEGSGGVGNSMYNGTATSATRLGLGI